MKQPSGTVEKKGEPVKRVEFHLPVIMLRTRIGLELMTRIGRLRPIKGLAWLYVAAFPLMAVIGVYLIVNTVLVYLTIPEAGQAARETGPLANLLIPGLNPYIPLVYGWIAVVVAILVHEGGHGVIARSLNLLVKSAGLLFVLIFPIGAFVEPDEVAMKKAKLKDAIRILAAGVGSNIITAIIFLLLIMTIVASLTPVTLAHGIGVVGVYQDYPAYKAGVRPGDVLININNHSIREVQDLTVIMDNLKPNQPVNLTFAHYDRREYGTILLAENPANASESFLGIEVVNDPQQILDTYKELSNSFSIIVFLIAPTLYTGPYMIPYSHVLHIFYTSPLGDWFYPLSNIFYWIWFVNFNLAVFNALPIYPLDGGEAISRIIKKLGGEKLRESTANRLTYTITAVMVLLIVLMVTLPYLQYL